MAYIKKKDRLLKEIKECINEVGNKEKDRIVFNKWPICIKDVCVDNIALLNDNLTIIGYNKYEDNSITNERIVNNLETRYLESILDTVKNGYNKKNK